MWEFWDSLVIFFGISLPIVQRSALCRQVKGKSFRFFYLLKDGFSLIFLFINSDVIFLMFIYVQLLDRMKLEEKFFRQNFLHTWSGVEFCKLSNLCHIDTLVMSHRHEWMNELMTNLIYLGINKSSAGFGLGLQGVNVEHVLWTQIPWWYL